MHHVTSSSSSWWAEDCAGIEEPHLTFVVEKTTKMGGSSMLSPERVVVNAGPYLPTDAKSVEEVLELLGLSATDYFVDLGSGDGRLVRAAAQHCHALGVEYDRDVLQSDCGITFLSTKEEVRDAMKNKSPDVDDEPVFSSCSTSSRASTRTGTVSDDARPRARGQALSKLLVPWTEDILGQDILGQDQVQVLLEAGEANEKGDARRTTSTSRRSCSTSTSSKLTGESDTNSNEEIEVKPLLVAEYLCCDLFTLLDPPQGQDADLQRGEDHPTRTSSATSVLGEGREVEFYISLSYLLREQLASGSFSSVDDQHGNLHEDALQRADLTWDPDARSRCVVIDTSKQNFHEKSASGSGNLSCPTTSYTTCFRRPRPVVDVLQRDASVVFLYLLPDMHNMIAPRLRSIFSDGKSRLRLVVAWWWPLEGLLCRRAVDVTATDSANAGKAFLYYREDQDYQQSDFLI
ncbi:unnamed protein product [Amoebophrya sp. A25]|nr:unnamed protein product [Amoebophrya sp. A25]|eukprot:GSA25T00011827001.1